MVTAEIVIAVAIGGVVLEKLYTLFVAPVIHRRNGKTPISNEMIEVHLAEIKTSIQAIETKFDNYAQITDWKIGTLAGRINTLESKD